MLFFQSLINCFNLTIGLRMSYWSITRLYSVLSTKIPASFTIELGAIIHNKSVWNSESTQDKVIEEASNLLFYDRRDDLSFNPLCKVVISNYYILLLPSWLPQRSYNIKAVLHDWLRACHIMQKGAWLSRNMCIFLTSLTFLHNIFGICPLSLAKNNQDVVP